MPAGAFNSKTEAIATNSTNRWDSTTLISTGIINEEDITYLIDSSTQLCSYKLAAKSPQRAAAQRGGSLASQKLVWSVSEPSTTSVKPWLTSLVFNLSIEVGPDCQNLETHTEESCVLRITDFSDSLSHNFLRTSEQAGYRPILIDWLYVAFACFRWIWDTHCHYRVMNSL